MRPLTEKKKRHVYIALDVGDVRIGVALSRSQIISEPHSIIERTGRRQTLNALQSIIESEAVTDCVIGIPLLPNGEKGEQTEKTESFARSLQRRFPTLCIHFMDERYSTDEAKEIRFRNQSRTTQKYCDDIAAALILQRHLEKHFKDKDN